MGSKNKKAETENSVSELEEKDGENFQKVQQEDKQVKIRTERKKKIKEMRRQVQTIEHLNNRRAKRDKRGNEITPENSPHLKGVFINEGPVIAQ